MSTGQPLIRIKTPLESSYSYVHVFKMETFLTCPGFVSLPLSVVLLGIAPYSLLVEDENRPSIDYIQRQWAMLSCKPFFDVRVVDITPQASNILGKPTPTVIVSNHTSWLDIYALFHLGYPIKFLSKQEVFYIPLVGWLCWILGHVPLDRKDKSSKHKAVSATKGKLEEGVNVVFFSEGEFVETSSMVLYVS